ncbi:endonuclease domain-containing protein [Bradyrhizobium sp. USDA 4011]
MTDSVGRKYVSRKRTKICANCGAPFHRKGTATRFCSRRCYGLSKAGNPIANRQSPPRLGSCIECTNCGDAVWRKPSAIRSNVFCSRSCSNSHNLNLFSTRSASAPTSLERILYDALSTLGLTFERQRRIGRFVVDAYLPTEGVAIEVDGEYWHSRPENIERDKRKDDAFRGYNIPLVRISEAQARSGIIEAVKAALP